MAGQRDRFYSPKKPHPYKLYLFKLDLLFLTTRLVLLCSYTSSEAREAQNAFDPIQVEWLQANQVQAGWSVIICINFIFIHG